MWILNKTDAKPKNVERRENKTDAKPKNIKLRDGC